MGTETRRRILEVAARLFHEQGFAATSVARILDEAGVNSGSLYHFFPGKGALLAGVMELHLESLGPTILDPVEATTGDPVERVFTLLDLYRRRLLASECVRGCPVGSLILEAGGLNPQVRPLVDEYFSTWTRRVREWLVSAGSRIPAEVDHGSLARLALAAVQGGVMQARAAGSVEPFDAAVAQLRSYVDLLEEVARRQSTRPRDVMSDAKKAPAEATAPEAEKADVASTAEPTGWRSW
jgi:AcrR family transcriptional regulator